MQLPNPLSQEVHLLPTKICNKGRKKTTEFFKKGGGNKTESLYWDTKINILVLLVCYIIHEYIEANFPLYKDATPGTAYTRSYSIISRLHYEIYSDLSAKPGSPSLEPYSSLYIKSNTNLVTIIKNSAKIVRLPPPQVMDKMN